MRVSLLLSGLLVGLLACQPENKPLSAAAGTIAVHDDLGRPLTLPVRPRRVLALVPSLTEMLYAVADTTTIIARTQADDYPAAVRHKPLVSSYPLDLERLVALRPDVVFTLEGMTPPDAAARLQQLGIAVYYQKYRTVADVLRGLNDLGRLLGRPAQARRLTDSLQAQLSQLATAPAPAHRPTVLALVSGDPIYVYGQNTLFTDMVRLAGGQNAVRDTFAQPFPALTREYILRLNPEVMLGGSLGKMDSTFFKNYPELRQIRACQTRRVYATTPNLLQRPSPRIVEAVRELQTLLSR
ncbi:ABC transporter substrate-binding protein [Hymenobacter baengnokdamensis]|uniref:ABC transporter substrate-binding protein n=1 Tax=Hymenobacter baengnokdamensis TaxID=2615203 RepID=UPI0012467F56|nr:helical backbone metal receptor [Hymenobacter baengnokdamensis]